MVSQFCLQCGGESLSSRGSLSGLSLSEGSLSGGGGGVGGCQSRRVETPSFYLRQRVVCILLEFILVLGDFSFRTSASTQIFKSSETPL